MERVVLEGHRFDYCITTNIAGGVWVARGDWLQASQTFLAILHFIPGCWLDLRHIASFYHQEVSFRTQFMETHDSQDAQPFACESKSHCVEVLLSLHAGQWQVPVCSC